jgi:transposase InsO family protein
MVGNQLDVTIKSIHMDHGTEYVNGNFQRIIVKSGIMHKQSVESTPEQNDIAKRTNRTVVEKDRMLLFDAGLIRCQWVFACEYSYLS